MTNPHTKNWKSIDEQIEILRDRGMIIEDNDHARLFLSRVGYYRLSGYWYPFRQVDENGNRIDAFMEGTSFENVIGLYQFDRRLKLLALDALERIELAVQVDIAHLLGRHAPYAHHDHRFLNRGFVKKSGSFGYQGWLENYHSLVKRSKATFVDHNLTKYGKLPIWVAVEVFDFGCLSIFFEGMKGRDKQVVSEKYGLLPGKTIASWLRSLNYIRNVSAHHSRLWNCNIVERASVQQHMKELRTTKNERPFLYFCLMKHMLDVICPESDWGDRMVALISAFPDIENEAVSLDNFGIVEGWESWALWENESRRLQSS